MVTTEASIERVLGHRERFRDCRTDRDAEIHERLAQIGQDVERGHAAVVPVARHVPAAANHRDPVALALEDLDGFAINAAIETPKRFAQRINLLAREEDQRGMNDDDLDGWMRGPNVRTHGSIHSDVWSGNATALAAERHIAVFPVGGWWKDWPQSGRVGATVHQYSLVVTLHVMNGVPPASLPDDRGNRLIAG